MEALGVIGSRLRFLQTTTDAQRNKESIPTVWQTNKCKQLPAPSFKQWWSGRKAECQVQRGQAGQAPRHVYTWGNGLQGQLGHGCYMNQPLPKIVEGLLHLDSSADTVVQCSCGNSYTACVTRLGKVFSWGKTQDNRLGHGNDNASVDQPVPKDIENCRTVVKVACGDAHTLAVSNDGKVLSWGKNNRGQCGRPDKRKDASASGNTGKNGSKEIDLWSHREVVPPLEVGAVVEGFPAGCRVVDVSCGKQHSIALSEDGVVYVWGAGGEGQLGMGDGDLKDQRYPVALPFAAFGDHRVVQVAAGSQFSAALTEDGKLYTWGLDQYGQLGHGKDSRCVAKPRLVRGLFRHPVQRVACGQYHMAVVTRNGEVFTWGYGRDGQLGHGQRTDLSIPTFVDSLGDTNVSVACGGGHTAVVRKTGTGNETSLWVFGRGREGQLGRAHHLESIVAYRTSPVEVDCFRLVGNVVEDVACGQDHTLAIVQESSVRA